MQQAEMTKNAETMRALKKRYDDIQRKAADELNDGKLAESIRYKKAIAAIEAERQTLFADYKAQKKAKQQPAEETEASND